MSFLEHLLVVVYYLLSMIIEAIVWVFQEFHRQHDMRILSWFNLPTYFIGCIPQDLFNLLLYL